MKKNITKNLPRPAEPRPVHLKAADLGRRRVPQTFQLLMTLAVFLTLSVTAVLAGQAPVMPESPGQLPTPTPASTSSPEATAADPDFAVNDLPSRDGSLESYLAYLAALQPTVTPMPTVTSVPTPTPIIVDAAGIPQEGMLPENFTEDGTIWYVSVNKANIRTQPGTSADLAGSLTRGDAVTRMSYGEFWSLVKTECGLEGFVLTDLLSHEFVARPTPSPSPTPRPTPGPTAAPVAPGSTLTDAQKSEIVALARSCLGIKYVYGSESMSGFDCSGFTTYVYKTLFGITLPRSARSQSGAGKPVSYADIEIGDIICFDWSDNDGIVDHVGLYIGGGQYIHASFSRGKVVESTLKATNPIVSIRRIIY